MGKNTQSESERGSVDLMATDSFQDFLQIRTLENTCPALKKYLKPDMKVLDIGCGPGTITLDVAKMLTRGSVTGMDLNEDALKNARRSAREAGLSNVEFKSGDCYSLEFPDGTFDLVYSHALFEWLQEPVKALKEQARVIRTGGMIIAMISSYDYTVLYPECPELRKLWTATRALKRAPADVIFFNTFAPHEVVSFIADAGFRKYKITGFTPDTEVAYPDSEYFEYRYNELLRTTTWNQLRKYYLELGIINKDTNEKARTEVETWHKHPHALYMRPAVVACVQVE